MTCFLCKGDREDGTTTHTVDIGGCIVVIKGVPAKICTQCGESWISGTVAKRIERIISDITQQSMTEIAVLHYSDKVA